MMPSLLTTAALFFGFFSIIYTLRSLLFGREEFLWAGISIVMAGFLDNLDGRLARLMKAESEFGLQFDSIADTVSFGVAPAVLVYGAALIHLDRIGWCGAFLFLACAAIRLARFNVSGVGSAKKYFKGLSSPAAAGGLAVSLLIISDFLEGSFFHYVILGITVLLALLMVSNIRFRSFKDMDVKRYPLQTFLVVALILVFIFSFRLVALFIIFLMYLAAGAFEEFFLWRRRRRSDPHVPFLPFGDRE